MSLFATLIGMLLPSLAKALTGFVVDTGSFPVLWATAVFLICTAVSQQMIMALREVAVNRIQTKTAMPVAAAFTMRLLSLPPAFFRTYSSGELASRCSSAQQLVNLIVSNVLSLGVTALFSLL